jgi:hypothetical protein
MLVEQNKDILARVSGRPEQLDSEKRLPGNIPVQLPMTLEDNIHQMEEFLSVASNFMQLVRLSFAFYCQYMYCN